MTIQYIIKDLKSSNYIYHIENYNYSSGSAASAKKFDTLEDAKEYAKKIVEKHPDKILQILMIYSK